MGGWDSSNFISFSSFKWQTEKPYISFTRLRTGLRTLHPSRHLAVTKQKFLLILLVIPKLLCVTRDTAHCNLCNVLSFHKMSILTSSANVKSMVSTLSLEVSVICVVNLSMSFRLRTLDGLWMPDAPSHRSFLAVDGGGGGGIIIIGVVSFELHEG